MFSRLLNIIAVARSKEPYNIKDNDKIVDNKKKKFAFVIMQMCIKKRFIVEKRKSGRIWEISGQAPSATS